MNEPPSPDRLAKELGRYLYAAGVRELWALGWYDFLRFDVPQSTDPRDIAAAALFQLAVVGGHTRNVSDVVLYAVLQYVQDKIGDGPRPTQAFRSLQQLLFSRCEAVEQLAEWFHETYPDPYP